MSGADTPTELPAPWPQRRARIEEVIGSGILARRVLLGLTQEELGKRLWGRLGRAWSRQAVSAAEKGKRAFTAAELIALADALGTSLGRLLTAPHNVDFVLLGNIEDADGPCFIDAHDLAKALVPVIAAGEPLDKVQDAIARLSADFKSGVTIIQRMAADLDALNAAVSAAAIQGIPADTPGGDDREPREG